MPRMEITSIDRLSDKRAIVFSIVLASGFLAVTGGASAILGESVGIGVGLVVVGAVAMGSSVGVATGEFDEALFEAP